MSSSLLERLRRKLRLGVPETGPPSWQRVESGLLAGLELFLPTDRRPASWVARMLHGDYEQQLVDEIARLASAGGTFYDIGGHAGFFSCAWLHLGGARVEIFEPAPDNARRIMETMTRNGFEGSTGVHHLALADFDGEASLIHNTTDIGLASMSHLESIGGVPKMRRQTTNSRVTVAVRRLDDLIEKLGLPPPRVVKIDVEGGEEQVVRGAASMLRGSSPVVFCEMHAIAPAVATSARLAAMGYTATALSAAGGMPVFRFDPPGEPHVKRNVPRTPSKERRIADSRPRTS